MISCPVTSRESLSAASVKPSLRPDPTIGTQISAYNQTLIWSVEHVPPTQLNEWRKHGDRLIDDFFARYGEQLQEGEDTLQFIEQLRLREHHICDEHCETGCIFNFAQYIRERPPWFDRDQIQRGQEFFLKHSASALTSIFYYTLILGYGFQQLNNVLAKTQYLSSLDLSQTYRRLVETLQMISSAVCGHVDTFDETFSDVIRVRFLHGMVRYHIMKHSRASTSEVPINQEDSLVTLLGFSFSVLYCIDERMGIRISNEDKQAYLHLWRYIGWLIGIEDEFLHYMSSYNLARIISESIFYHYYLPSQISKHMVHHSLMAIYAHGQMPVSLQFHVGMCQRLLGEEFSRALDIHQPIVDRFHGYAIALVLKSFQLGSWLTTFNWRKFNDWIMVRNKQRLNDIIYTVLNHRLCNFALFKSFHPSRRSTRTTSLKDCCCGYYEKKHGREIKTNDILLFRVKRSLSDTSRLHNALVLISIVFLVRWWTNVVI